MEPSLEINANPGTTQSPIPAPIKKTGEPEGFFDKFKAVLFGVNKAGYTSGGLLILKSQEHTEAAGKWSRLGHATLAVLKGLASAAAIIGGIHAWPALAGVGALLAVAGLFAFGMGQGEAGLALLTAGASVAGAPILLPIIFTKSAYHDAKLAVTGKA